MINKELAIAKKKNVVTEALNLVNSWNETDFYL